MNAYDVITCRCPEGPYRGVRQAGYAEQCERCGRMTEEQLLYLQGQGKEMAYEDVAGRVVGELHGAAHLATIATQYQSDRTAAHVVLDIVASWLKAQAQIARELNGATDV